MAQRRGTAALPAHSAVAPRSPRKCPPRWRPRDTAGTRHGTAPRACGVAEGSRVQYSSSAGQRTSGRRSSILYSATAKWPCSLASPARNRSTTTRRTRCGRGSHWCIFCHLSSKWDPSGDTVHCLKNWLNSGASRGIRVDGPGEHHALDTLRVSGCHFHVDDRTGVVTDHDDPLDAEPIEDGRSLHRHSRRRPAARARGPSSHTPAYPWRRRAAHVRARASLPRTHRPNGVSGAAAGAVSLHPRRRRRSDLPHPRVAKRPLHCRACCQRTGVAADSPITVIPGPDPPFDDQPVGHVRVRLDESLGHFRRPPLEQEHGLVDRIRQRAAKHQFPTVASGPRERKMPRPGIALASRGNPAPAYRKAGSDSWCSSVRSAHTFVANAEGPVILPEKSLRGRVGARHGPCPCRRRALGCSRNDPSPVMTSGL